MVQKWQEAAEADLEHWGQAPRGSRSAGRVCSVQSD